MFQVKLRQLVHSLVHKIVNCFDDKYKKIVQCDWCIATEFIGTIQLCKTDLKCMRNVKDNTFCVQQTFYQIMDGDLLIPLLAVKLLVQLIALMYLQLITPPAVNHFSFS